jgi:hypothetical protein
MNAGTHRLQTGKVVLGSKVRFFNPQCLLSHDRSVASGSNPEIQVNPAAGGP